VRVFPISNWTELDVWEYIKRENIQLPSIYFTHQRECILTEHGQLMNTNEFVQIDENDTLVTRSVRYRTVGDMTCTAAVESEAHTVEDIIQEIKETKISERGATRMDDRVSEAAMEDRKKGGYF
jgi:sulfate adenylyltransferase subunit 2